MLKPRTNRASVPRPCACTTVRTASRALARAFDAALIDTDLSVTQLAVLRAIERQENESLSSVADALSMDRTSLYRSVGTMQRQGWVTVGEGRDARSKSARVTKVGREVLDGAAPQWELAQTTIVQRFGLARWKSMVAEIAELMEVAIAVEHEMSAERQQGDDA